jgi:hypothetical protein
LLVCWVKSILISSFHVLLKKYNPESRKAVVERRGFKPIFLIKNSALRLW